MMLNKIQSREYSKDGATDGVLYITFNGNANACYVWFNDSKRKSNLNWQNNFGNDNDWFCFRNSLHFSLNLLWIGGVLFCELTVPPAQHLADLVELYRKGEIFLIIYRLHFPYHHQQYFQRVELSDCYTHIGLFLRSSEEARQCHGFHYFHEQFVNPHAKGVSVCLRQGLVVAIPKNIGRR